MNNKYFQKKYKEKQVVIGVFVNPWDIGKMFFYSAHHSTHFSLQYGHFCKEGVKEVMEMKP